MLGLFQVNNYLNVEPHPVLVFGTGGGRKGRNGSEVPVVGQSPEETTETWRPPPRSLSYHFSWSKSPLVIVACGQQQADELDCLRTHYTEGLSNDN
jgi:hypothetical protein